MQRKRLIVLVAVLAVLGSLVYLQSNSVGMVKRGDGTITKILGAGGSNATFESAIALQEGGDLGHESEHIFEAISAVDGVKRATLSEDGPTIKVEYDKDVVSEEAVAQPLRAAGYVR